jgi:hypothetical protein
VIITGALAGAGGRLRRDRPRARAG